MRGAGDGGSGGLRDRCCSLRSEAAAPGLPHARVEGHPGLLEQHHGVRPAVREVHERESPELAAPRSDQNGARAEACAWGEPAPATVLQRQVPAPARVKGPHLSLLGRWCVCTQPVPQREPVRTAALRRQGLRWAGCPRAAKQSSLTSGVFLKCERHPPCSRRHHWPVRKVGEGGSRAEREVRWSLLWGRRCADPCLDPCPDLCCPASGPTSAVVADVPAPSSSRSAFTAGRRRCTKPSVTTSTRARSWRRCGLWSASATCTWPPGRPRGGSPTGLCWRASHCTSRTC